VLGRLGLRSDVYLSLFCFLSCIQLSIIYSFVWSRRPYVIHKISNVFDNAWLQISCDLDSTKSPLISAKEEPVNACSLALSKTPTL